MNRILDNVTATRSFEIWLDSMVARRHQKVTTVIYCFWQISLTASDFEVASVASGINWNRRRFTVHRKHYANENPVLLNNIAYGLDFFFFFCAQQILPIICGRDQWPLISQLWALDRPAVSWSANTKLIINLLIGLPASLLRTAKLSDHKGYWTLHNEFQKLYPFF